MCYYFSLGSLKVRQSLQIQSCTNFFLSPSDASSIWQVRKWIGVWASWPLPPRHAVGKQTQKKEIIRTKHFEFRSPAQVMRRGRLRKRGAAVGNPSKGAGAEVGGRFGGCQAPGAFTPAGSASISVPPAEAIRANLHLPPHPPPLFPSLPAPPSLGCARRLQLSPPKVSSRAAAAPACRGALVTQQQNSEAKALTAPGASQAPFWPHTSYGCGPRHPQPEPPFSPTSPAASSERDLQQCLRSGDYDVDASPPTQLLKMVS